MPGTDSAPVERYARAEQLEQEIAELCAHLNAATYRLLQLIVELDEEQPWGAWGLSCAQWLNWRCGIGLNAAREKVRVAHALKELPLISAAFGAGELSYSKVRAMTRVATAANEAYLLMIAREGTAAQVEKLVRVYRGVERIEERERAERHDEDRSLQYFYDEDGCLVIRARLAPEQGAVVVQALEAAVDALRKDAEEKRDTGTEETGETGATATVATRNVTAVTSAHDRGDGTTVAQRRADALGLMAETLLSIGSQPLSTAERYQVVVHVTAETLGGQAGGRCELDDGPWLARDTARRLACEASVTQITEDGYGNPLAIGRKTRAIPPAMHRALKSRDAGCRFPGCTRHRFVDAHHIEHWADGGETRIDNLVQLCRHHHRLLHEGGFGLTRTGDGTLEFTRPDGHVIDTNGARGARSSTDLWRVNRQVGLSIDLQKLIVPMGDRMDYDMAIDGMLQCRDKGRAPEWLDV